MICNKCNKEISAEQARHCSRCGKDYCPHCAQTLCDCSGELGYYQ